MKVFLKYISKNMFEKKGRLFLLLFSIAMSTALLVASLGIIDVAIDGLNAPYESGNMQDVRITSRTDDPYLMEADVSTEGLKDVVFELQTAGIINEDDKIRYTYLRGRKSYEGDLVEGETDFLAAKSGEEPSCILSTRIAKERSLSVGDSMKLFLSGKEMTFRVGAIAADNGLFYSDTKNSFNIVVPYEFLNEQLSANGGYNVILANVASGSVSSFVDSFNEANTSLEATDQKANVVVDDSINAALYTMMAIVVIVSAIIIYGVFKLILAERITVIGTFMSQGATKKKIERIILMEGFLYGVLGGIFGCVLGEVCLYYIGRMVSPLADYGIYTPFQIYPAYIAAGMIFSILLSVASAFIPVRSVRKLEVKDVILNRVDNHRGRRIVKPVIGILLLGFSGVVFFLNDRVVDFTSPLGFMTAFLGIVFLTPALVKCVMALLARLFKNHTTMYLTMNNIRSSKLLRNNIVLIVISLSAVLMIASFGVSMTKMVRDAYAEMSYDYDVEGMMEIDPNRATTDMIVERLEQEDGIEKESICPVYYEQAEVDGEIAFLTGIEPEAYIGVLDGYFEFRDKYETEMKALEASEDNAVVLTTKIADAIDKEAGDTVTIKVNAKEVEFRIAGIYDGKLYNNGLSILVKKEIIRSVFQVNEASSIYFRVSGDASEVEENLKPFLASLGTTYLTKAEETDRNDEQNQMLVQILSIFSYLALIIASIGVFNNITISFLQRKREMAVMASVGMNKKGRRRLILSESMICVVCSILISIPFAYLLADLLTGLCYYIGVPMEVFFGWSTVPVYAAAITVIILIASLSTMRRSKKLSIVQELKYE